MNVPFFNLKNQFGTIKDDLMNEIENIIDNTAFIGGSKVQQFEREVAEYLGVKYAIGCSSGTAALMLALRACDVNPGDEVITTPFTFFATAEAISAVGAIPVFVDVYEADYNINVEKIEEAITSKTKAILPVHIFGAPCEMDVILKIAEKHNLRVIEDCAQAIGSKYKGRHAGTMGDVGCFSFYPTKNLGGAGDGGMVTTNDDDLANALLAFCEHGAGLTGLKAKSFLEGVEGELNTDEKVTELYNPYKYYNYLIGYNSRLDAIQASVLSVKLKKLDSYNSRRSEIAKKYFDGLTEKIKLPTYSENTIPCWHQFVITTEYKKELCSYLSEKNIGTGTFYPVPLHKQKAFDAKNSVVSGESLPVAEKLAMETVCLPVFPELTDEQVDYVIEMVNSFFEGK